MPLNIDLPEDFTAGATGHVEAHEATNVAANAIGDAVDTLSATALHRVVEANGVYPTRPSTGYADFLGITDPTSVMQTGDTWTQLPATVPNAPTIGTATGGDTSASVAFTVPTWSGGAAITGYTATSTPGSITGTGSSSPISVAGLTNGTAYTFTVHATNSVGNSAESSASNSVTPSAGGGGSSLPTVSTGTLFAHFAADALALSNGANVTTWTKSAGSMSGNLASSGTAPTFQTNQLNSKPAVRFGGAGYFASSTAGTLSQPFTRFIVCRSASVPSSNQAIIDSDTSGAWTVLFAEGGQTGFGFYAGATVHSQTGFTVTNAHVVELVANTTASGVVVDGTALPFIDAGSNSQQGLRVGANNSGGENYIGDIFEVVIYSGALDATDRSAVRSYLQTKYGI